MAIIRSRWRWILAWLALSALLAGVGSRVPTTQSPDENQHLTRAWTLAHGLWLLRVPEGGMSGSDVDPNLDTYIWGMLRGWAGEPALRTPPERIAELRELRWHPEHERRFTPIPGTGYYFPLVYLPQALALRIGEALDWTIDRSCRLARTLTQLVTAALLIAAWRAARPCRPPPIVPALLALPMTLFQFAAPTIDGLTTGMALLALALAWRSIATGESPSRAAITVLGLCLLMVSTTRLHALPMLALPLLMAWRLRRPSLAWLGAGLVVLSLVWTAWAAAITVDTRIVRPIGALALAGHYLAAPWEFLAVVGRTVASPDWRAFIGASFVGNLGWLDTPLSPGAYRVLQAGLLVLIIVPLAARWMASRRRTPAPMTQTDAGGMLTRVSLGFRGAFAAMAAASALIVFAALLVTWSAHPARVVDGMQGRYLLLPAILLGMAILPGMMAGSRRETVVSWSLLAAFTLCSTVIVLQTLQVRYGL